MSDSMTSNIKALKWRGEGMGVGVGEGGVGGWGVLEKVSRDILPDVHTKEQRTDNTIFKINFTMRYFILRPYVYTHAHAP